MNIFKKPAARFLAKRSALGLPAGFATIEIPQLWALNSAVECHLHTVEVTGSNPVAPTIFFKGLRGICPKSRSTNRSTKFIESSPRPVPVLSGMRPARPVFLHHHPGCRDPASSEYGNDAGCFARSSDRPSPCSPTSLRVSAGGYAGRSVGLA